MASQGGQVDAPPTCQLETFTQRPTSLQPYIAQTRPAFHCPCLAKMCQLPSLPNPKSAGQRPVQPSPQAEQGLAGTHQARLSKGDSTSSSTDKKHQGRSGRDLLVQARQSLVLSPQLGLPEDKPPSIDQSRELAQLPVHSRPPSRPGAPLPSTSWQSPKGCLTTRHLHPIID